MNHPNNTRKRCHLCNQCSAADSMIDGACVDCRAELAEWRLLAECTPTPRTAAQREFRDRIQYTRVKGG
jgi:predicted ATP-dependent serine protease